MRRTRGWTGLRTSAVALTLAAGLASAAQAEPLINYSTSGTIGLTGIDGPNVISFNSVAESSYDAPSNFSLGDFLVAPLAPAVQVTYTDTPFAITYLTNSIDGTPPEPNETPISITGVLNGSVTGDGRSSVVATFNPVSIADVDADANGLLRTGDWYNSLTILDATVSLVPSTTNGGRTTAQARNEVTPVVPEPTTIALFLTAIAGAGLRQRARARKV